MTLVERYALAMRLVDRHGNQYGDRDLLTLTHQQIREGLKALVVSEREACAKVCEDEASRAKWNWGNDLPQNQPFWNGGEQLASSCAAAIRARGEQ
jgi:hypothetical protein